MSKGGSVSSSGWILSLSSVPFLTARKMIIEEFSCMFVIMRWHTILLKVAHFLQKQNFWWMAWCCPAALIIGQHLYHVHQRKMIVLVFQKTENTTCRFVMARYTQWCWLAVPLILRGFIRPQCKEEKFSSSTRAETCFRDTSLKGALLYRLLARLKACSTIVTLWTVGGLPVGPCLQWEKVYDMDL